MLKEFTESSLQIYAGIC